jgi:hypothetical protein
MKAKEVIELFKNAKMLGRHGDVVVVQAESDPPLSAECEDMCVAYGEVTGHAHRVDNAKVFTIVNDAIQRAIIVSKAKAKLSHEEHKDGELPPGTYRTGIQQQYSPEGWARVTD